MVINVEKYAFFTDGLEAGLSDNLARLFNIPFKASDDHLKYLELILNHNRYRENNWIWIVARI